MVRFVSRQKGAGPADATDEDEDEEDEEDALRPAAGRARICDAVSAASAVEVDPPVVNDDCTFSRSFGLPPISVARPAAPVAAPLPLPLPLPPAAPPPSPVPPSHGWLEGMYRLPIAAARRRITISRLRGLLRRMDGPRSACDVADEVEEEEVEEEAGADADGADPTADPGKGAIAGD